MSGVAPDWPTCGVAPWTGRKPNTEAAVFGYPMPERGSRSQPSGPPAVSVPGKVQTPMPLVLEQQAIDGIHGAGKHRKMVTPRGGFFFQRRPVCQFRR